MNIAFCSICIELMIYLHHTALWRTTIRHLLPFKYIDAVARVGSIRKAADQLAITSTALNRRILSMEEELGVPLFERLPGGVRLSVAGELFIHHARKQLSDLERLKSQIADLSGERRGHVAIVCGQALVENFIPEMITQYRAEHPGVTFDVRVCNRFNVRQPLIDYSADIALVFEPEPFQEFQKIMEVSQPIRAVLKQSHPLSSKKQLRLSECIQFPMAMPSSSNSVRHLVEQSALRLNQNLNIVIESDIQTLLIRSLDDNETLSFQIPIYEDNKNTTGSYSYVDISHNDITPGNLQVGYLKGRTLPVAAARFLEQIREELAQRFEHVL